MKTVIYPGTFDPITNGHIDILKKASRVFDRVILSVAEDTGKSTLFTVEEREQLCRGAVSDIANVEVMKFSGLVVNFAREVNAIAMIRGLRAISDFEYELSQALMNEKLSNRFSTIFFVPDYKYLYLSSSMIRQVISLGGSINNLLPPGVEEALRKKLNL